MVDAEQAGQREDDPPGRNSKRISFQRMGQTLGEAGESLADIATMTVFIVDMNNGKRFLELRKEIFKHDFPASALIGISKLARPEMTIEIQAVAVVD